MEYFEDLFYGVDAEAEGAGAGKKKKGTPASIYYYITIMHHMCDSFVE